MHEVTCLKYNIKDLLNAEFPHVHFVFVWFPGRLTLDAWWGPPIWDLGGFQTFRGPFRWPEGPGGGHPTSLLSPSNPSSGKPAKKDFMREPGFFCWRHIVLIIQHNLEIMVISHYLRKLYVGRVAYHWAIRLLVSGVANQLRIPHPEVVLPISSRRKNGYCRPWIIKNNHLWPFLSMNIFIASFVKLLKGSRSVMPTLCFLY